MLAEQNRISGAWVISELVDGTLITRTYLFSSKRDAVRAFRKEFREYVYLRYQSDYLDDANRYPSKRAACDAYMSTALELDRYGQTIVASLHYARNKNELAEYPDYLLSLGPRKGLKIERA